MVKCTRALTFNVEVVQCKGSTQFVLQLIMKRVSWSFDDSFKDCTYMALCSWS